jgi:epoxyqueuosine reductase
MTPVAAGLAREAHALGSPRADYVRGWCADGRAGEMTWLVRTSEDRIDPTRRFAWARSAIVVAWPYPAPPPAPADWREQLTGRVAAYALGRDYHDQVRGRLGTLVQKLGRLLPGARFQRYVDTGPLLERELGVAAGLGWIGKHTLLLHRAAGSWFVLGTILTSAPLEPIAPSADHCGSCRRCVAVCPTGALEQGYTIDPRRCISYLTIEHRTAIDPRWRPAIENWVFGCDVCQEVCPWNAPAIPVPDDRGWWFPSLPELAGLDEAAFRHRFRGSAVLRATRRGLVRNAAIALGNTGNPAAIPPLTNALADADPLVRGHAAWALGHLGFPAARAALDRHRPTEPDPAARREIDDALEGRPKIPS